MATIVSFVAFDINRLDFNFYVRSFVRNDFGDNANTLFGGVTYPDEFAIEGNNGSLDLAVFLLGDGFVQGAQGALTAGTVNAIAEAEMTTQSVLWFAQGLSLPAAQFHAAAATSTGDDDASWLAQALSGDDTVVLSALDDLIGTFGGNDTITGGAGDDVIDGGAGTDTAIYTQPIDGVSAIFQNNTLFLRVPGAGDDELTNVEFVQFSTGTRSVASLSDLVKPVIAGSNPAIAATGVPAGQNITITFSEPVTRGAGTIFLREFDPAGAAIASFDVATSAAVTVSGSTMTIDPPANLEAGIRYSLILPQGAVLDSAGNRFAGSSEVYFTVFGNAPAFTTAPVSLTTAEDTAIQFTAIASDADGGPLTYGAGETQKGVVTRASDGTYTYTPKPNATGADAFTLTVTDRGGLTGTLAVTVTITPVNDPPTAPANRTVFVSAGAQATFSVGANDPDGDVLLYTATAPLHGALAQGSGGAFTYSPAAGFTGADSVVVTVSDQHGGTATQAVDLIVQTSFTDNWRLFTQSGLVARIGGSGQIFGSSLFDDITVVDSPGRVTFDPSFNRGGDTVHLSGEAFGWFARFSGSNVILTDGDTQVILPIGTGNLALAFDDGVRMLRLVPAQQTIFLGDQALTTTAAEIRAPGSDVVLPGDPDEAAVGRLFLSSAVEGVATASVGGAIQVFGTVRPDAVSVISGDIVFDTSFNKGGDRITFNAPAGDFSAKVVGSSADIASALLHVSLPVGLVNNVLVFEGGDERALAINTQAAAVALGDQLLSAVPVALAPFG